MGAPPERHPVLGPVHTMPPVRLITVRREKALSRWTERREERAGCSVASNCLMYAKKDVHSLTNPQYRSGENAPYAHDTAVH